MRKDRKRACRVRERLHPVLERELVERVAERRHQVRDATADLRGAVCVLDDADVPAGGVADHARRMSKGEPGAADTIAITLWNKNGGLWFSSRWSGTTTLEQLLGGGILVVH
jgi:hypothetical protein